MKLTIFIIILVLVLIFITRVMIPSSKNNLYSLPSDINIKNLETYIFKSCRQKRIDLDKFSDVVYLSPKFSSTYYNSIYNNICDLRENSITAMYLTTIGNINLASKMLHSMIYIMMDNGWTPYTPLSKDRLSKYKGMPNLYNIDILDSTVSMQVRYSDIASIYLSIALMKFLLTYDTTLSSNTRYPQIRKLYIYAAYDIWKYIVDTQRCKETGVSPFYSYKTSDGDFPSEFTTSFHIAMLSCCNYLEIIKEKYGLGIDSELSISQVSNLCKDFISNANVGGFINYKFTNCSILIPEDDIYLQNKVCEDYLNLLLIGYYQDNSSDQNTLIENVLDEFYIPDTDSLPTGCGPGIYNIECNDKSTAISDCYNISCDPKYVPSNRIMYGMKWSSKGSGLTFAMSAMTIMTLAIKQTQLSEQLFILKNTLIKIFREYQGLYVLGGFQEELAFYSNPYNTGTGESIFRYPSLLAVVMTGFLFLYLTTRDGELVNYMVPTTKISNMSNSTLDFDDSPLFLLL